MRASEYRTKTMFVEKDNTVVPGYWGMGIDIGYGGCKLYAPNICAVFPSYAKRIDLSSFLGEFAVDDIIYTDKKTGESWLVGRSAQNMMQDTDTNDSMDALCGRNRYFTPLFLVLARTCMGIGMMKTVNGVHECLNDMIPVVQTGLPCKYINGDTPLIKEAFSGEHDFEIRIGQGKTYHFHFTLPMENILVMQQPKGAFISAATDANWKQDISKFASSNTLIVDPGFYTFDTFSVRGRTVDSKESWSEFSMSTILTETSKAIYEQYGTELPPAAMQRHLETGMFTKFIRKEMKTVQIEFSGLLNMKSKEICDRAVAKLCDMYNNFLDHKYLIITGGTGAAWAGWISEKLHSMSTLTIIAGDTADGMPMYFANARGYYSYLISYLKTLNPEKKV